MTTLNTPVGGVRRGGPRPAVSQWQVFLAVLRRDAYVTAKDFASLLLQIALLPLFMLFVFAKVLGSQGYVTAQYGRLLLSGIVALTAFITAMQAVALQLVLEFGHTREIEDRLLAPIAVHLIALEKIVMAMIRGIVASAAIYPIGILVLGTAPWRNAGLPLLLAMVLLGSWVGAGIGVTLGTLVPPAKVGMLVGLVLTPVMFTGCTQYPWPALSSIRWFQIVTLINPLTYCSEGVRAAMVPDVPHMRPWICVLLLVVAGITFTVTSIRCFDRRAIG